MHTPGILMHIADALLVESDAQAHPRQDVYSVCDSNERHRVSNRHDDFVTEALTFASGLRRIRYRDTVRPAGSIPSRWSRSR